MSRELVIHYAKQQQDLDTNEFYSTTHEETIDNYRQLAVIVSSAIWFYISDAETGEKLELADARRFLNQKHQESLYD